ncbi:aldo/keto reductase [Virgibacillus ndiopensis]|uniref:aldo/keto reductase n=1 Tax=Virgibacillus ndiopensis TaxID=2004408 RepID=UPI000C07DE23|nr:aldo/keto reductase [Virgibacillus ndiopensis]
MEYTTLKKTDLKISRIGIGTNKVGGAIYYDHTDPSQGKNFVKEAIWNGINFIDTADMYTDGRSEKLLGEVLQEIEQKREDIVLATKGAIEKLPDGTTRINNKPAYLRSALEASLKRLNQDYIDLYYLHFPDDKTPISESVGELSQIKEEGKIKAIGVSNLSIEQLKEANKVAEISTFQFGYNMLDRTAEQEILPYCVENNISFIPYFPLASGILSGKYSILSTFDDGDPRQKRFKGDDARKKFEIATKLKDFAATKGINLPQLALAWLLAQNGVDAVIPGGRRPEQAQSNAKTIDITLSLDDLKTIESILD